MAVRLVPAVLAALAAVGVAHAAAPKVQPVTYDRSCEKTATTQMALDACAGTELAELAPQLAAALAAARAHYPPKPIGAAETQWLRFRTAECTAEGALYAGGSIQPMIETDCEVGLTAARIEELRQIAANAH
jgi:uncharacterized protein YecT (DUF1311 family)